MIFLYFNLQKTKKEIIKVDATIRRGMKVKDSDTNLVIHVKPCDIRGAVCRDHQKCVIAKAIKRQRKVSAKWVDVGNSVVLIAGLNGSAKRYFLDTQAKKQVRYFDHNDGAFAPCAVKLVPPPESVRLGARAGQPRGTDPKKKKRAKSVMPTR